MAKKKKEEPVVDNETGSLKVKEKVEKQPDGNETKGNVTKVKQKMKKPAEVVEETITKVDLNKPTEVTEEVKEDTPEQTETPVIEEVTNEEVADVAESVVQAIDTAEQTGTELPEGIQKVVDFMSETGGDLNDYVRLNQDYSEMDNQTILEEYYKQTKPHLSEDERSFLMEDQFAFDEDVDDDRDIKKKKIALKEQVANAKSHLDGQKSKYYEEIKSGSKLTSEQQEAINFYNEQRSTAKANEEISSDFVNKTNRFFGDQFKGFEYNVGDKTFRYNVGDVNKVKEDQTDINNFIRKFLNEEGKMVKESDYHKSLYTAMNSDAVAKHFYEQGKADAMKNSVAESKNLSMEPRQELSDSVDTGGIKVRALDLDTSEFKYRIKNK